VSAAGTLAISLDFELFWGVHDKRTLADYGRNILGGREAIPRMLELFARHDVHATWATVGLLFFDDKEELLQQLPAERPQYLNPALSPYPLIPNIGANESKDPYHYGLSLIRRIQACPGQEIATHTFSHYYCLEAGQTPEQFRADLCAAGRAAERLGISLRSLVFPRNQFNQVYLEICRDAGIRTVRGNQRSWLYQTRPNRKEGLIQRGCRRVDHYLSLSGDNNVAPEQPAHGMIDLRSSRFLLPVSGRIGPLASLALKRITDGMTHAARTGGVYHLWWHPHNFGADPEANMKLLTEVLDHHRRLADAAGMVSRSMDEIAQTGRLGLERDPGPATEGALSSPQRLAGQSLGV
jgi:peptidoglycan/xylan/chitin deacetylase (PgdA/CDA1 family)